MVEYFPLPPPPPRLIPFLPDEISILCIARVHVSSHTAIAQVSRSWRSFVRSPSFFSLRSELSVTELVLTVSTFHSSERRNRWYHLHPYQTPFPLPLTDEEHEHDEGFACASLGPHLFIIGGYSSPNSLKIYDGCLRRWSHGPPTSTPHDHATVGVAGGRIHVFDDCINSPSLPFAESLDATGTRWDPVPPIPAHLFLNWCYAMHITDGKLLVGSKRDRQVFGGAAAAFDPGTAEWAHAPQWWDYDEVVVGGVPYVFRDWLLGYGNDGQWRLVEGESLTELLNRMIKNGVRGVNGVRAVRLLTFGGLLCLVGKETGDGFSMCIFAGIDISRTANGGFRGSIMWLDSSLKHSKEECLDQCVVLEL